MYREMGNNTNDKIGKVIILKNLIIELRKNMQKPLINGLINAIL